MFHFINKQLQIFEFNFTIFKASIYKDLLNQKVKGLNLSKDASEFRKQYVRIGKDKIELDIKTILSQYSQSGKLGK